jgi:PAS domain S-box-containing protein
MTVDFSDVGADHQSHRMTDVMEFWQKLFDTSDFPPRWYCGDWTAGHGWLHIASDIAIWAAYFAIPCILGYFMWQRKDFPFRGILFLFVSFILLCGTTHLMEAVIFWWPAYRLAAVIKVLTATVSCITAVTLVRITPIALAMRSPKELQREIDARARAELALVEANNALEQRVQDRTAELVEINTQLRLEREWFSATLRSIGDAVITTDSQRRITMCNAVACELTGWSQEAAIGESLTSVFSPIDESSGLPTENPAVKALETGAIVGLANHAILIDRNGVRRPIDDSASPIRDDNGNIVGVVLIFRDVTERREAESMLRQANSELESRVQLRTSELTHANQFMHALLENLSDGIVACDQDGNLTLFNAATRAFHQLPPKVIDSSQWPSVYDLYVADESRRMTIDEVPLMRALRGERVKDVEMVISPPDGERRVVLASGQAFHDTNGTVLGAVVSMHDVTQQMAADQVLRNLNAELEQRVKNRTYDLSSANESLQNEVQERRRAEANLRKSESRFRQLADAMPQIVWVARPDGSVEYFNQRWFDFVGCEATDFLGHGWTDALHPHDQKFAIQRWQLAIDTQEPYEIEYRLRSANGDYRWFLSRAMLMHDESGSLDRWFGTCTDIQDLKGLHEELRMVAARLSEADRRKDEFLATLAHELRNPLAPIRTGLEVMKLIKDDPITLEEVRETMERQTRQLITLVDDLLDVSRITRGKFDLRRSHVCLDDSVKSAVEAAKSLVSAAGHQLSIHLPDEPIWLDADPNRLTQILSNLLNNAAKYTPNNGEIALTAKVVDGTCCISVRDNGIGIPADKLETIFDMFTQLEQPIDKIYTGLGIGLTLVKSLVQMHGGRIEVSSEGVSKGSEFRVYLPLVQATTSSAADSGPGLIKEPGNAKARGMKILVVDDNLDAAKMLSRVVAAMGCEVATAADGKDAIEKAEEYRPNLILMDLGMPRMNGYEAVRHIRQQPWGEKMVVVALTGWGQDVDRQKSKEAGFDHHLVKPADPQELRQLFESLGNSQTVQTEGN